MSTVHLRLDPQYSIDQLRFVLDSHRLPPATVNEAIRAAERMAPELPRFCSMWETLCYDVAGELAGKPDNVHRIESVFRGVNGALQIQANTFLKIRIGRALPSAAHSEVTRQAFEQMRNAGANLPTLEEMLGRAAKHAHLDIGGYKKELARILTSTSYSDTITHANQAANLLSEALLADKEIAGATKSIAIAAGAIEAPRKTSFAKTCGCALLGTIGVTVFMTKLYETFAGSKNEDGDGRTQRDWTKTCTNAGIALAGAATAAAAFWLDSKHPPGR